MQPQTPPQPSVQIPVTTPVVPSVPELTKIQQVVKPFIRYIPVAVPVVLVAVNALIDNGSLTLAPHTLSFFNAILAALGLGALHIRTK